MRPSRVVQSLTQQIQDGGRPPSWKIEKSPYLVRILTDFDQICQDDAFRPSWAANQTGTTLSPCLVHQKAHFGFSCNCTCGIDPGEVVLTVPPAYLVWLLGWMVWFYQTMCTCAYLRYRVHIGMSGGESRLQKVVLCTKIWRSIGEVGARGFCLA